MTFDFNALGTKWWLSLPKGIGIKVRSEIDTIVNTFENNYSRFIDSSLISKLNKEKIIINPSDELINMLRYSLDVYDATDGIFNISIGTMLEKNGYGKVNDNNCRVSIDLRKDIHISPEKISINKDTRIDLGGFGKGWLIEKLAGYLKSINIDNFIINGGGDVISCGKPTKIYIEHPIDNSMQIGEIVLSNKSLASSSNLKRTWSYKDKQFSHIINPKTYSTTNLASMHVLCDSILIADTFATIFFLCNRTERMELSKRYNLEFMEVMPDLSVFKTNGFNILLNQ